MSVRKASKREIQKEERRAIASKPESRTKTYAESGEQMAAEFKKAEAEAIRTIIPVKESKFPKKARFPDRKIAK